MLKAKQSKGKERKGYKRGVVVEVIDSVNNDAQQCVSCSQRKVFFYSVFMKFIYYLIILFIY